MAGGAVGGFCERADANETFGDCARGRGFEGGCCGGGRKRGLGVGGCGRGKEGLTP